MDLLRDILISSTFRQLLSGLCLLNKLFFCSLDRKFSFLGSNGKNLHNLALFHYANKSLGLNACACTLIWTQTHDQDLWWKFLDVYRALQVQWKARLYIAQYMFNGVRSLLWNVWGVFSCSCSICVIPLRCPWNHEKGIEYTCTLFSGCVQGISLDKSHKCRPRKVFKGSN